ncbi:unnamed protein product [Discula destructiva]
MALALPLAAVIPPTVAAAVAPSISMDPLFILAPDDTCGYIEGQKDHPLVCNGKSDTCALYFPTSFYAVNPDWTHGPTTTSSVPMVTEKDVDALTATTSSPRRRRLRPRNPTSEAAPVVTPAPVFNSANIGAFACCDPRQGKCTLQPTACVDNDLHPASVLCTGNCSDDDMTLKCTSERGMRCRQIQMATPIAYVERRGFADDKFRRRDGDEDSNNAPQLATFNNAVRGWFCGMREVQSEMMSGSKELSTYLHDMTATDVLGAESSTATKTQSHETITTETHSEEAHVTETHPDESSSTGVHAEDDHPHSNHQPGPQPISNPSPVEPKQHPPIPVDNAQCEWIDDFGNCCDESEAAYRNPPQAPPPVNNNVECEWIDDLGNCCNESQAAYYNPRRLQRVRRSENEDEGESTALAIAATTNPLIWTYTHSLTTGIRPLITLTPLGAPKTTIVEAIYIVDYTYTDQTDRPPMSEGATFWSVVPYSDPNKASATPQKTGNPHTRHPHTDSKGADPQAGMKAGIAIGAVALLAILVFAVVYFRRRLKTKRASSQRDSEAGPTRSRLGSDSRSASTRSRVL